MFNRKDKKQEEQQRQRFVLYKQVFLEDRGREVLRNLMNSFYVLNPHAGDAYKEGQRSVVLHILHNCHINIDRFDALIEDMMQGDDE